MPKANAQDDKMIVKKIKDLEKQIGKLQKEIAQLNIHLKTSRSEAESELKATKREVTSLFDEQSDLAQKINSLSNINSQMTDLLDAASSNISNLKQEIDGIKSVLDPEAFQSLKTSLKMISDAIIDLRKASEKNLKLFEKTDVRLKGLSDDVTKVEEESLRLQESAKEVSEKQEELNKSLEQFFSQVDAINSKLNNNVSAIADLTDALELVKNKANELESKINELLLLKSTVYSIQAALADLQKKVDLIEKVSVKTFVID